MTKKGLIATLMTVTFAFMWSFSHAAAPVIIDPGDVIVGDLEQDDAENVFVFPDAFDLDGIVSDDSTADGLIKWSWTDSVLPSIYTINGVPPMDIAGGDDPDNPPAGNRIDANDNDVLTSPPGIQDTDAGTVTFRNQNLSPGNGGNGPYPDPVPNTTGVLASETRTITLFASDCTTHSMRTITVYTANKTSDSLSGGASVLIPDRDDDFDGMDNLISGWYGSKTGPGVATTGTSTGLCMWVPLANTAGTGAGWLSPPNFAPFPQPAYVTLVDQAVFRVRLTMYTDQTAVGAIPFWTFGYNNANFEAGTHPPGNTYGGDFWALDVAGGSNGINSFRSPLNGRDFYDYWICPAAALTAQWRGQQSNGAPYDFAESTFNPAFDDVNDFNFLIRILDGAQGAGTIHNEADTGTICVKELKVDHIAIASLASRTTPAYVNPISTTLFAVNPDTFGSPGDGSGLIDNATNSATFRVGPNYSGATAAQKAGGRKQMIFYDPSGPSGSDFNKSLYPIAWNDNELLQIKTVIRSGAPTFVGGGTGTTEGTDPVDVFFINADTPTSEIGGFNFVQKSVPTNMYKAGSPRLRANTLGVGQTYTAFFFSQNATDIDLSTPGYANAKRIRMYTEGDNNNALGSATDGQDPYIIDSEALYYIDTTGFN